MIENMEEYQQQNLKKKFSKLYPMVDEHQTPFPKCWNIKDKSRFLNLSNRNLRIHYKGFGEDAASIRATHYIPLASGLYYFEIKIIDKGQHGYIVIGLATRKANLNYLPGWENTSYGYHGATGHKCHLSEIGLPYGPGYTVGDTIGCGINFLDKSCFFTKNGCYLGVAFQNMPSSLFPIVGMQSKGEIVECNFGEDKFLFDTTFIKDELKTRIKQNINNFPYTDSNRIHECILSYLIHHGYIESAITFAKLTNQTINEDLQSITDRRNIMELIRQGKIDKAINFTNKLYPNLLKKKEDLHFRLLCRQFIELFTVTEDTMLSMESETNTNLITNDITFNENNLRLLKILKLGREIYSFNKKLSFSNLDVSTWKMKEAFSLIAYNDPLNSNMKWLLDSARREPLCYELNSAIMQYLGRPALTTLDLAPCMAKDLLHLMARSYIPSAAFVNVPDFIKEKRSKLQVNGRHLWFTSLPLSKV